MVARAAGHCCRYWSHVEGAGIEFRVDLLQVQPGRTRDLSWLEDGVVGEDHGVVRACQGNCCTPLEREVNKLQVF